MQGGNTNFESQRPRTKHDEEALMRNNRTQQRSVNKQQGSERYLNINNNKEASKNTNKT